MQRKFLMLGRPGDALAAALVEGHKFCYLYRPTTTRQEYGQHQVYDMALESGESVLGAALLGGRCVVLLTQRSLLVLET